MATLTVYSDSSDGYVRSDASNYSDAREGNGSLAVVDTSDDTVIAAQREGAGTWRVYEGFFSYDTSSLGGGASLSAVDFSLFGTRDDPSGTAFIVNAYFKDWGASLASGDFVAGSSLSGLPLLATFDDSVTWSDTGYNTFAENGSTFQNNIAKTGTTYVLTASKRTEDGTAPSTGTNEWVWARYAEATGTTQDPKLVVTYTSISISSVTPSTFADSDTGVTIAGSGFEASQGTGKVELGDSSDYATATLVAQTVTAWSDTSTDFTVDQGALSSGTVYAFVTNDAGNTTAGFAVTLQKSASGTAAIAVIADPSATGTKQASGSAALATVAATNATGSKQGDGAASLAAIAATAATGSKQTSGAAALAVIAATAASGSGSEAVAGTAAITVIAALAASGAKHETGAAAIVVTVSLSALGSSPGEVLLYRGQQGQGLDHPQGRGLPTGKATI